MIKKYRKKPVTIEAMRFTIDNGFDFITWAERGGPHEIRYYPESQRLAIVTLEGTMEAKIGDWVIKGLKGEFYPCADEIFRMSYDEVKP